MDDSADFAHACKLAFEYELRYPSFGYIMAEVETRCKIRELICNLYRNSNSPYVFQYEMVIGVVRRALNCTMADATAIVDNFLDLEGIRYVRSHV